MRVTKTVKDYIAKEVASRMEKKYSNEAAEARRQRDLCENIESAALLAATKAYEAVVNQSIQENHAEDILEISKAFSEGIQLSYTYRSNKLRLIHENEIDSVLGWRVRMRNEINEKCEEIIVTLELGGTKAELMQMLAEI